MTAESASRYSAAASAAMSVSPGVELALVLVLTQDPSVRIERKPPPGNVQVNTKP